MILTLFCWVALIAFIGFSVKKFMYYSNMPQHGRQDLYPIPLESDEKFKYGGSYMEEDNWHAKERHHNLKRELIDMFEEMLFIKKLFIHQNKFWWLSYSLHLGMYAAIAWSVLLVLGAFIPAGNIIATIVYLLTTVAGLVAGVLITIGGIGLLCKRLFVKEYKIYTTPQEIFNLVALTSVGLTGLLTWYTTGMSFEYGYNMVRAMFTFSPMAEVFGGAVPTMLVVHILLLGFISFYIPLSKMSHYVGKFFTFHKVIWDNEPNMPGSKVEQNILNAANKPKDPNALKWAAPHWNEAPAPAANEEK
ncbi:MAG: respiratory nitrate reductase subunit gamma [Peptococcaceae bacterium]|nr:respiratory nitrate reductase subunit gamma [Peptococcaceae bacterium]